MLVNRWIKNGLLLVNATSKILGDRYWNRKIDHQSYAESLFKIIGEAKGPLIKVLQALATIPDALPQEYTNAFLKLQSKAPPMAPSLVKRILDQELGAQWRSHFSNFETEPYAAASLGQVHKAIGLDGTLLACKVQYPNIQKIVKSDLKQLEWVLNIYQHFQKALDPKDIQKEVYERLIEETDYKKELGNIELFQKIFKDFDWVQIPKPVRALSTSRVLTMSWMEGQNLFQIVDKSRSYQEWMAKALFKAWYYPFYKHGVLHADPHPGNYFGKEEMLQIVDFGCLRIFSYAFVQAVINLYHALLHNDSALLVYAYEQWGFKNLSKEMIETLNQWARLLYAPVLEDKIQPLQPDFSGQKGWEVARKVYQKLQKLGGIRPPREFIFMDRCAVVLGGSFMRLKVELNWHRLFEELISEKFTELSSQEEDGESH